MSKRAREDDPMERARRKLARAQLKLHVAEDEQVQIRAKGKQEVEKARLRAAQWQAKAAERVEKRVASVMRAEARMEKLLGASVADVTGVTPSDSVERLREIEEQVADPSDGLLLPDDSVPDETHIDH